MNFDFKVEVVNASSSLVKVWCWTCYNWSSRCGVGVGVFLVLTIRIKPQPIEEAVYSNMHVRFRLTEAVVY